jgi:hypothetical protein
MCIKQQQCRPLHTRTCNAVLNSMGAQLEARQMAGKWVGAVWTCSAVPSHSTKGTGGGGWAPGTTTLMRRPAFCSCSAIMAVLDAHIHSPPLCIKISWRLQPRRKLKGKMCCKYSYIKAQFQQCMHAPHYPLVMLSLHLHLLEIIGEGRNTKFM